MSLSTPSNTSKPSGDRRITTGGLVRSNVTMVSRWNARGERIGT